MEVSNNEYAEQSAADNSGLLFSTVVMVSIAGISLWSFLLLMQAYMVVPGSFGGELLELQSTKANAFRYGRSIVREIHANFNSYLPHCFSDWFRMR